jgi:hypothetical protein
MWARAAIGAAGLLVAVTACSDGDDDDAGTTAVVTSPVIEAGPVAAIELVVGDCLGQVAVGARERSRIASAPVVSCERSHSLEVFAEFVLDPAAFATDPPGAYPGQERVVDAADQGCVAELERLADEAAFGLMALWPTPDSWGQGDRTVACAVFRSDGMPFESRQLLAAG